MDLPILIKKKCLAKTSQTVDQMLHVNVKYDFIWINHDDIYI